MTQPMAPDDGPHRYLSTYCLHDICGDCREFCKWCPAQCEHTCHGGAVEPDAGPHVYLSTSCRHGQHRHCWSETALSGAPKVPARCMWCPAECVCQCHRRLATPG